MEYGYKLIFLVEGRIQWRVPINTVLEFRIQVRGDITERWETVSVARLESFISTADLCDIIYVTSNG
jgi:hypothetical protein